jgi:hypothetical protein
MNGGDRIRNEYVRGSNGEASIVDKMKENKPRWFRPCDEVRGNKSSKSGYKIER